MKNITHIRTILLPIILMTTALLSISSCTDKTKAVDTKVVAEEHNEAKFNTIANEKDAQFMVNIAEANLEEVKLGELAQKTSKMVDVQDLGKMMVAAHTKILSDLTVLAKQKAITVPTASTNNAQETYKNLSIKTGTSFDKNYCDIVVEAHKDAIAAFEKVSAESNDADIKKWSLATLPELRMHLDKAINCQAKCEKMK